MLDFALPFNLGADWGLTLFPLRVMLFQGLLLVVAIAMEAWVLGQKLGVSPRGSVQFATLLNLFSTIMGWLMFLVLEVLLPERWRWEVMNYVLFDRPFQLEAQSISTLVVCFVLITFIATFFLETQALNLLLLILRTQPQIRKDTSQVQSNRMNRYQASWTDRYRMNTLLMANAYSYSAILVLLILRQTLT
ncbi:MAG: filament integrity protein FraC [Prochlorothrix sp.]|nr:hypothetical protein [Prochlorothrix sp.]